MRRIDEVIVQVVFREYDDLSGLPVGEMVSGAAKVYRAAAPQFWEYIDQLLVEINKKEQQDKVN